MRSHSRICGSRDWPSEAGEQHAAGWPSAVGAVAGGQHVGALLVVVGQHVGALLGVVGQHVGALLGVVGQHFGAPLDVGQHVDVSAAAGRHSASVGALRAMGSITASMLSVGLLPRASSCATLSASHHSASLEEGGRVGHV